MGRWQLHPESCEAAELSAATPSLQYTHIELQVHSSLSASVYRIFQRRAEKAASRKLYVSLMLLHV